MENKNLDGQLSFDSDFESKAKDQSEPIHTVEFEIGKPSEKENFIFEISHDKEQNAPEKIEEIKEPIVEELVIGKPPVSPKISEAPVEENQSPSSEQTAFSRRRAVYVPKFTEASEKYRKTVDTRSRASMTELRRSARVAVDGSESVSPILISHENVDPTAEIDYTPANQVVVNVSNVEPEPEVLNVFKFKNEEPKVAEAVEVPVDEEKELREIEELIAPDPVECEAEAEDTTEEEVAAEEASESALVPLEEDNFVMPDPDGAVAIRDYVDVNEKKPEAPKPKFVMEDNSQETKNSGEFSHQSQRDSFNDRFLDTLLAHKIRIGAIGIFSLVLLVFEFLAFSEVITARLLPGSNYLGMLAVVDFLFVASIFLLSLPETIKAVSEICSKKVTFNLSLPASFVVILIYSVVLMIVPEKSYALYGFVFALSALVSVIGSYYRTLGDFTSFKHVSENCEKKFLDIEATTDLDEESLALDGLVVGYKSKTAKIHRTAFVADFFDRIYRSSDKDSQSILVFAIPFGAAFLSAVLAFFVLGGLVSALSAFTLVFLLSCPVFVLLSGKLPYYDAQENAIYENSTVVGEKAYYDFSEVDVIAFEDTEIFGVEDVNLKRFMLYGDSDNIERAMRQMYSLFSVVGGPLYKIFANALDNRVRHSPAVNVQIEADGVSGEVSGSKIFAGTADYMRRHGVAIPSGSGSDVGAETTKIMYSAENGEVYAKFYIRYSFSEEFTMILPSLREKNIVPLIYTNDPNLSNDLLKVLSAGADCMRVVKKMNPASDRDIIHRRVSAGVVTYGDKVNAINTILLTGKYKAFAEKISVSALYSISLGAAISVILSVLGVSLPSVVFGLWHVAWCIALRYDSRKTFALEKKSNK